MSTKAFLKRIVPVILLTIFIGSQSLAAEANLYVDLYGPRCRNSTCGAYLTQRQIYPGSCSYCGAGLDTYRCNICHWNYVICDNKKDPHYIEVITN